jgi:hypothetical protein
LDCNRVEIGKKIKKLKRLKKNYLVNRWRASRGVGIR